MSAAVAQESALSREQALHEVLRIENWTRPLLQRTVGLTWMLWAAVNGGIFVSYEAVGIANPPGPIAWAASGVLWIPWVALGTAATWMLWRSLALVLPSKSQGGFSTTLFAAGIFVVLAIGGLALITLAKVPIDGVSFAMIAIGIGTAAVGGTGLTTESRAERIFWTSGGMGLIALAVTIDLISAFVGYDAATLLLIMGPLASTALLFSGGLYTASA